ncbi:DUF6194 family protein [Streptomyces lonarensis]|uniref:DUF6194 domain-containing protein n=1 Tax=Streptomyces lonarensis TaxID=700599 RepID=A0A7X6HZ53_9ACTN|nr:DUF6194 family protein [Streptomyces lonarensis]NJQ06105.1 hypothetical protein [Streptomyces lonarensis]
MSMDEVLEKLLKAMRTFDGVLEVAPGEGSGFPEVAWGDHFFYFAPDGRMPERGQPYATVVTKNQPGDALSELDRPGRWRLNVHVGRRAFTELTGEEPGDPAGDRDHAATDVLQPHPVYRSHGWVAIVNPTDRSLPELLRLLRSAHDDARRRAARRDTTG